MSDDMIPGWLPGQQPERFGDSMYVTRPALVSRSTLTDGQVERLVRDGRLTPHKVAANKRLTMFALDEIAALFRPVPASEA